MESKTSSGQILVECAIGMVILAILFASILDFNVSKNRKGISKQKIIVNKQTTDLRQYRNGEK